MSLNGQVKGTDWTVTCTTESTPDGVGCMISVEHLKGECGRFMHRFKHAQTYPSEREAVLGGLREGMTWINLKADNAIEL